MENEMSEVEKLMKKTEAQNKDKADFPLGATIGFLLVGAMCSLGTDNFWGTFGLISGVILFFAFISSVAKPMNSTELKNQFGEPMEGSQKDTSPDYINDPTYSIMAGNTYHSDN